MVVCDIRGEIVVVGCCLFIQLWYSTTVKEYLERDIVVLVKVVSKTFHFFLFGFRLLPPLLPMVFLMPGTLSASGLVLGVIRPV